MKNKKFTAITLGLVLAAVCAVGAMTAFAADENAAGVEPAVIAQEPVAIAQEPVAVPALSIQAADVSEKKDESGKKATFDKGSMGFVGIDAVAAEVLGVSEESLAGLNHADELYAELAEAGKVDEFKVALIAAKQAQYDAKAGLGKYSAEELAEKLAGYTQVINDWDGATELVVTSSKTKFK